MPGYSPNIQLLREIAAPGGEAAVGFDPTKTTQVWTGRNKNPLIGAFLSEPCFLSVRIGYNPSFSGSGQWVVMYWTGGNYCGGGTTRQGHSVESYNGYLRAYDSSGNQVDVLAVEKIG